MARIVKIPLSFSDSGRLIAVPEDTPTSIHRAISQGYGFDEVWLWASNLDGAVDVLLEIWWGTSAISDRIIKTIPFASMELVIPGWIISNGNLIQARYPAGAYADPITVYGHVNRVFQKTQQVGPVEE